MPSEPSPASQWVGPWHWVTRIEAAIYCRCSVSTIRRAVQRGELQEGRSGRKAVYQLRWLDDWMTKTAVAVATIVMALAIGALACSLGVEPARDTMAWLHCPFSPRGM